MTATNHAVTGVLVAAAINRPAIALPAALLSHFAIDEIPHWDHAFKNQLYSKISYIVDIFLAVAIMVVMMLTLKTSAYLVLGAGVLGMLPDLMWITEFNGPRLAKERNKNTWNKIRWFFHIVQWSETPKGFFVEAIWLILTLIILFKNFVG